MEFIFNHHAISSQDLAKSAAFYQGFLGLKRVEDWCGGAPDGSWKIDFYCDGKTPWMLEVKWTAGDRVPYDHGTIGQDHIAFAVEDVSAAIALARSLGYHSTEPDENGNCMVTDPDGYLIELLDAKALEE